MLAPLTDRGSIEARLATVALLVDDALTREAMRTALDGVRDVERLGAKIASGRATPRDVAALGASLAQLPEVRENVSQLQRRGTSQLLERLLEEWDDCAEEAEAIKRTIVEHPPLSIGE